jgi:CheY-like chemotaxis protein
MEIAPAASAPFCAFMEPPAARRGDVSRIRNDEPACFMIRFATESKAKAARIILVDDHPIVREGLAESINRESDLAVCAEADDRAEAIQAIEAAKPTW